MFLSSVDDPFIPVNEPRLLAKGQLISEWIYAVIFPPKMPTKKKLPTLTKKSPKKCYDPYLYGRADILVIFGLHFGRNDDLINSFRI